MLHMNKYISLINGKFQNTISVLDRGLAYGDGFFETMLWDSYGKNEEKIGVEFWNRHLKRINKGCKLMKINIDFSINKLLIYTNLVLNNQVLARCLFIFSIQKC